MKKKNASFSNKYNFVPTNYRFIFKFQYMPLKQKYSNLWKKLKSVPVEKKSVRESEKHGKKWTWNHFFACKETSKRGQKLVSRAVLLFKGEETGCILIRSLGKTVKRTPYEFCLRRVPSGGKTILTFSKRPKDNLDFESVKHSS